MTKKQEERKIMIDFFLSIWKERPHKSEVSGTKIYGDPFTTYFHHIFPKSKYPEYALDRDNIIILLPDEHQKAEQDMYFYEEINKRREKLKTKYNI